MSHYTYHGHALLSILQLEPVCHHGGTVIIINIHEGACGCHSLTITHTLTHTPNEVMWSAFIRKREIKNVGQRWI